jgi:hypothetical protein
MKKELKEAAENHQKGGYEWQNEKRKSFIAGAKWQAEKMYSEDALKSAFRTGFNIGYGSHVSELNLKEEICKTWFEQVKKK